MFKIIEIDQKIDFHRIETSIIEISLLSSIDLVFDIYIDPRTTDWLICNFTTQVVFTHNVFNVRLHVMQRTVLLSEFCPSVRPSDACIVTKLNNALRIFWYHT